MPSEVADPAQVVTEHHRLLHRRSPVENGKVLFSGCAQRHRCRQRGRHRAAPARGPERIADARNEAQLERVRQVPRIGESAATTRMREKLERRLAKTVLEILPAQPVAVGAQQDVPPRASDQGDLVDRVAQLSGAA